MARPLLLALVVGACTSTVPAHAERVFDRAALIGGPSALGDVGDYKLSNGRIRAIVQGPGLGNDPTNPREIKRKFSRGWAVFTGSLVDVDLVRPSDEANAAGQGGHDLFGELFPAFFLEALEPKAIGIPRYCDGRAPAVLVCRSGHDGPLADGSPGCPASEQRRGGCPALVRIEGDGSGFLTETEFLSKFLGLDPAVLEFAAVYALDPNAPWIRMTGTITSVDQANHSFPVASFPVPFGAVLLFGARNSVFAPGVGFDLFYGVADSYAHKLKAPALPGVVADLVATAAPGGEGVSYGYAAEPTAQSFVKRHADQYGPQPPGSVLLPIFASGFTGAFSDELPATLKPGESFSSTGYFLVGHGDVGSVRDAFYELRGTPTGRVLGLVREAKSGVPLARASVVVDRVLGDGTLSPFVQYETDVAGAFAGALEPGDYAARVVQDQVRNTSSPVRFSVVAGQLTRVTDPGDRFLTAPQSGQLAVVVRDEAGRLVPARVTLVARYDPRHAGELPRKFLFDLPRGERLLPTQSQPLADATKNAFEERYLMAVDGHVSADVRAPAVYTAFASRGPEYGVERLEGVTVRPGELTTLRFTLHHEVPTPGWISGDFHVHSGQSIDSAIDLRSRVATYAVEGVDYLVSTDHNFVTDLQPALQAQNLTDWLRTAIGIELTTLEMGHFNGFPIAYQPGTVTHGSFDWVRATPDSIFTGLRARAKYPDPKDFVVQVNHPRDSITGYLRQFNFDPVRAAARVATGAVTPTGEAWGCPNPGHDLTTCTNAAFSFGFDALEILNGKRMDLFRTFTAANGQPVRVPCGADPSCVPSAQEVAYPGNIDDWLAILETGRPITGTGNSDSHGITLDEAGYPRNYVKVPDGHDTPRTLVDREVVESVREHHVVASNGPILDLSVNGVGVGGLASQNDGIAHVSGSVTCASWMRVDKVQLLQEGGAAGRVVVEWAVPAAAPGAVQHFAFNKDVAVKKDTFFVAIASGSQDMWPVFTPNPLPTVTVGDAAAAIAGSFLPSSAASGPQPVQQVAMTPYAVTNPVWLDYDGDGVSFGRSAEGALGTASQGLTAAPRPPAPTTRAPRSTDLRRLLLNLTHELHTYGGRE